MGHSSLNCLLRAGPSPATLSLAGPSDVPQNYLSGIVQALINGGVILENGRFLSHGTLNIINTSIHISFFMEAPMVSTGPYPVMQNHLLEIQNSRPSAVKKITWTYFPEDQLSRLNQFDFDHF